MQTATPLTKWSSLQEGVRRQSRVQADCHAHRQRPPPLTSASTVGVHICHICCLRWLTLASSFSRIFVSNLRGSTRILSLLSLSLSPLSLSRSHLKNGTPHAREHRNTPFLTYLNSFSAFSSRGRFYSFFSTRLSALSVALFCFRYSIEHIYSYSYIHI